MAEVDLAPAVVRHSIGVRDFALQIADNLESKGHSINRPLLESAALLHDIMKVDAEIDHALEGGEFLRNKGFHPVADLVEKHALNNLSNESLIPRTTEEKLLMYADLRFSSGRVVSLDERFNYIKERYGPKNPDKFHIYVDFAKKLEAEFNGQNLSSEVLR
ncbi:HD domain-containing protein [Nanoarchaeota archaeon]